MTDGRDANFEYAANLLAALGLTMKDFERDVERLWRISTLHPLDPHLHF